MGWLNNSMTPDRFQNSVQILNVAASMGESKTQVDNVNTFVNAQRQRAQGLVGQAFAVQGASSALGRELQNAINELGSCLTMGQSLSEEIDSSIGALSFIASQFTTPRLSRSLNMSGRNMAALVTNGAIEIRENIDLMRNRHAGPVLHAITAVDRADRELNGSRSTMARDSIPRLD